MMDEITFEDVLSHYQNRLSDIYDQIQDLRNDVKLAIELVETGWKGHAADACMDKLNYYSEALYKADGEVSEALVQIAAIGAENLT